MVSRPTVSVFPLLLGVSLLLTGCAQVGQRSDGQGLFGKKAKKSAEGPPAAAPALYIPTPTSSPAPTPTITPVSATVPAGPAPLEAETLPLQAPRASDPNTNGPAPLPPLVAAPQQVEPPSPISPLRDLYLKAAQKHASMDSYTLRLKRREVVGSQNRPEEVLLCKFRKEPWSVYFKWVGAEGKGREVVYVKGRYESALHTLTAAGDIFLLPAGKRIKVSPDSVLVKSKSRYPITEAGLGGLIDRFGRLVAALEKGDTREGTAKYLGQLKRPEYDHKVEAVLQTIPPKSDVHLPRGGQRHWFFDPNLHLPMLIITQDETGREVEYYCHDRFMFPVNLNDDDFNPDVLWKNPPAN